MGLAVVNLLLVFPGVTPFRAGAPEGVGAQAVAAPAVEAPKVAAGPPVVRVHDGGIALDGVFLASTAGIERIQRIVPLYEALQRRRHEEMFAEPGEAPKRVVLAIDTDVSAFVVKSVYQTAVFAGYTDVGFALEDGGVLGGRP